MKIGVDVDGIIGDQVPHLLRRVRHKYGIRMRKSDIELWDQPMGRTSFVREMDEAVLDREFLLTMPLIPGAREGLSQLASRNFIMIVTSRPPSTDHMTAEWLRRKGLHFDELISTSKEPKENAPIDILIDDRLENVRNFALTGRLAIMLSQPWNTDDQIVAELLKQRAVIRAAKWKEIVRAVEALSKP